MAPAGHQNSALRAVAVIAAVSALIAIAAGIAARTSDADERPSGANTDAGTTATTTTTTTSTTTSTSTTTTTTTTTPGPRVAPTPSTRERAIEAKATWEQLNVDDYEFTVWLYAFPASSGGSARITVRNGRAVEADGHPIPDSGLPATIDEFVALATPAAGAPTSATVSWDKHGIPTAYYELGQLENPYPGRYLDRSLSFGITDFAPL